MPVSPGVHRRLNRLSTMMTGTKSPAPAYSPVRKAGFSSMVSPRRKKKTLNNRRQHLIDRKPKKRPTLLVPALPVGVGFYYDAVSSCLKASIESTMTVRDEKGWELFYNFRGITLST